MPESSYKLRWIKTLFRKVNIIMASPILGELTAEVTATVGVMQSATVFINGTAARLEAAVQKAIANGATAEELAPVVEEISALKSERDSLAAAIDLNDGVEPEPEVTEIP